MKPHKGHGWLPYASLFRKKEISVLVVVAVAAVPVDSNGHTPERLSHSNDF